MQNRDRECLLRIIEHCQRILDAQKRFGDSSDKFCSDADYRDVINMNIFQIGELSNQLSDSIKNKINDIPWHEIHGIRNVMAHAYIIVDNSTIWTTVKNDIPKLMARLSKEV